MSMEALSDSELKTKLSEYGYPVGPVTQTTRKILLKKLKNLMESRGGAASLHSMAARYSSDDTDDDTSASAKEKKKVPVNTPRQTLANPMPPPASASIASSSTSKSPVKRYLRSNAKERVIENEVIDEGYLRTMGNLSLRDHNYSLPIKMDDLSIKELKSRLSSCGFNKHIVNEALRIFLVIALEETLVSCGDAHTNSAMAVSPKSRGTLDILVCGMCHMIFRDLSLFTTHVKENCMGESAIPELRKDDLEVYAFQMWKSQYSHFNDQRTIDLAMQEWSNLPSDEKVLFRRVANTMRNSMFIDSLTKKRTQTQRTFTIRKKRRNALNRNTKLIKQYLKKSREDRKRIDSKSAPKTTPAERDDENHDIETDDDSDIQVD